MTATTETATEVGADTGRRWALRTAALAMALTLLPYLFGWYLQGADASRGWYSWLAYNLDDSSVYLSWMRQAADGHFFQRNLFTTDEQVGRQFNLFFLLLGNIARLLHLPLLFVYHASRVAVGVALLRAVWWLLEMLVRSEGARRTAFLVVCFSAGLGWVPGLWSRTGIQAPVDVWQPEAITYLCLYLSPLFLVSLLLMVGVIGFLLTGLRTGRFRYALYAGLCGLILGNIHTYDVITLMAVWGGFLVVRTVSERRLEARAWGQAIAAGLLTGISTAYMYYLVRTEEVFQARVNVATLSPDVRLYLLAYLPLMAFAAVGIRAAMRRDGSEKRLVHDRQSLQLLATWAVLNIVVAYLPVTFNRKMLMGVHIPLSILAGVGLYTLQSALARAWPALAGASALLPLLLASRYLPAAVIAGAAPAALIMVAALTARRRAGEEGAQWAAVVGAVGLLSITNTLFSARDMQNFLENRGQSLIQRPYMFPGEISALDWLRQNAPAGAAIQPLPWIQQTDQGKTAFVDTSMACFAPGLTGHPVHAGHWGETPDFGRTMQRWVRFIHPATPDTDRTALLRETGVKYVVFSQKLEGDPAGEALLSLFRMSPPPYLRMIPEASNEHADVYEVLLP